MNNNWRASTVNQGTASTDNETKECRLEKPNTDLSMLLWSRYSIEHRLVVDCSFASMLWPSTTGPSFKSHVDYLLNVGGGCYSVTFELAFCDHILLVLTATVVAS